MRTNTIRFGFRATLIAMAAALALAGCGEGQGPKGDPGPAGPAGPPGPPGKDGTSSSSIRTLTSGSCAADGCPLSCAADETLVSALCVGATSARFSDAITLTNGILTARCGPSSTSIVLSCARK